MNSKIQFIVFLLIVALPYTLKAQSSFQAKMMNRRLGSKTIYQVRSDGEKYRYDFIESGHKIIVIVNPATEKTAILMPQKKYIQSTKTSSRKSRMNDPVQAVMATKNNFVEKKIGTEEIAGYTCTKSELYYADQKMFTLWFSHQLNFPLRIENNLNPQEYMELYAINEQKTEPSIFIIPEDYTEVDEKMRPVIAELPAPEKWNTMKVDLPFNKEYSRGDLIRFTIPETKNYIVKLTNKSDSPTKITRNTLRNGKPLPDNEQGPLKYRTTRLFANESSNNTYSWTAGDTIVMKVYEGKLNIEIKTENQ